MFSVLILDTTKLILLYMVLLSCNTSSLPSQTTDKVQDNIGGPCEICDLYVVDMPDQLSSVDTSLLWSVEQELKIIGQVLQADGKTPAADVILFYWHTDKNGIYPPPSMQNSASRLGTVKGWIKTDMEGHYTLHTSRPAAYPNGNEPAHIHWIIKEPNLDTPYYIDAMTFDDDTLLTTKVRSSYENRGGSMILSPVMTPEGEVAEKNIILGRNIPNHPSKH